MVKHILYNGQLIALIIPAGFAEHGVHFFTEDHYLQQLAFMRHPPGKVIDAHTHNPVQREVQYTQEVPGANDTDRKSIGTFMPVSTNMIYLHGIALPQSIP